MDVQPRSNRRFFEDVCHAWDEGNVKDWAALRVKLPNCLLTTFQPPPDVSLNILDFPVSTYHSSNV